MQKASPSDLLIFTNKDGYVTLQTACRQFNDRLAKVEDPSVGEIGFDGIPLIHCPQLDTELLDQSTGIGGVHQPGVPGRLPAALLGEQHDPGAGVPQEQHHEPQACVPGHGTCRM